MPGQVESAAQSGPLHPALRRLSVLASFIIPAHNESAVIADTLESLLDSIGDQPVGVIVVCNGCTDDTADRAREFEPAVTVLETEVASKIHALNLGDDCADRFPRIYLDADVRVSPSFAADMVRALETDEVRAAWPSVRYELSGCSWAVRAFYHVWTALPYNQPGRIGVGVYGLNQAARERFAEFPDVISDDGYVRGLFADNERVLVSTCRTTVQVPLTLRDLVKIRTRSRLGVYELRRKQPAVLRGHRTQTTFGETLRVLASPAVLCRLPVYLYVNVLARLRARRQLRSKTRYRWERDDSSRSRNAPRPNPETPSAAT